MYEREKQLNQSKPNETNGKEQDAWDNLFICHCHWRRSAVNKYDPLHSIFFKTTKCQLTFSWSLKDRNTTHVNTFTVLIRILHRRFLCNSRSFAKFYDSDHFKFIFHKTCSKFFWRQFLISFVFFQVKMKQNKWFLAINRKTNVLQRLHRFLSVLLFEINKPFVTFILTHKTQSFWKSEWKKQTNK